jgi:hypothetical protein
VELSHPLATIFDLNDSGGGAAELNGLNAFPEVAREPREVEAAKQTEKAESGQKQRKHATERRQTDRQDTRPESLQRISAPAHHDLQRQQVKTMHSEVTKIQQEQV